MSTATYNETRWIIETRQCTGTLNLDTTISGAAVVDNGNGTVTLETNDAHGFLAGSQLYIEGLTNYNGTCEVTEVTTSGITIKKNYIAETPDGTETIGFVVDPGCDFRLLEASLHLSAAAATEEEFVCTLDAHAGSAYDEVVFSEDVNGHANIVWSGERLFVNGDKLRFTLPNTDGRTYGLMIKYLRIR